MFIVYVYRFWILFSCSSLFDVSATTMSSPNEFEQANFSLFVAAGVSSDLRSYLPGCGHTKITPCYDFLAVLRRFCRVYSNSYSYMRNSNVELPTLTLHLLPGDHSVKTPNFSRAMIDRKAYGSTRFLISDTCDFGRCFANLNIVGESVESTAILLTSAENTSASCAKSGTFTVFSRQKEGWVFLRFSAPTRVQVSNITFKTSLPAEGNHFFFLLDQVMDFNRINC